MVKIYTVFEGCFIEKNYFVIMIMIMFDQMHLCYMNTITCFCFSFAPLFHLIFLFRLKVNTMFMPFDFRFEWICENN